MLSGASVDFLGPLRSKVVGAHNLENRMVKNAKSEAEIQLDLELDRELEATFPASDALTLTRAGSQTALKRDAQPKPKERQKTR
jgi:hypothetical protein